MPFTNDPSDKRHYEPISTVYNPTTHNSHGGKIESASPVDTRIALQVSLTRSFDTGEGVTWATTLPQSATLEQINEIMDKVWAASTRQSILHRIDQANKDIAHAIQALAQFRYTIASLEDKHKEISKAPSETRVAYTQTKENIIRHETLIKELRTHQLGMRAELGHG